MAFDPNIGLWAYLHLRKDKAVPNFIDTVLGAPQRPIPSPPMSP